VNSIESNFTNEFFNDLQGLCKLESEDFSNLNSLTHIIFFGSGGVKGLVTATFLTRLFLWIDNTSSFGMFQTSY